jgi:ribosomal 50S subunit-recycling heat shock protein
MTFTADTPGERLDAFLARVADMSRSAAQKLIEQGNVLKNGKKPKKNDRLEPGDTIEVEIPEPVAVDIQPTEMDLQIVYEDDDVLVINKPKGLVVHPAAGWTTSPLGLLMTSTSSSSYTISSGISLATMSTSLGSGMKNSTASPIFSLSFFLPGLPFRFTQPSSMSRWAAERLISSAQRARKASSRSPAVSA